jgi:hypothetical protein
MTNKMRKINEKIVHLGVKFECRLILFNLVVTIANNVIL